MDRFCQERFWDANQTWYTEVPDFSSCFQDLVFVTAPNVIFCGIFLLSIWSLIKLSSFTSLLWTWLNITKLDSRICSRSLTRIEIIQPIALDVVE
ncbi:uncharacterized protein CEXT_409581 [Caerostris extrusa]|uniref:Uncharacterized protein n=1 Tax=Caerostris extrusa TaxID=172846 RepID=A0AAV4N7N9_CAEEX|nr:uncharacterized protein CEXT_409581 [Caerostris extrusa]